MKLTDLHFVRTHSNSRFFRVLWGIDEGVGESEQNERHKWSAKKMEARKPEDKI